MTIKELKEKIKYLPDHMDVLIMQESEEGGFSQAEEAKVRTITFYDDENDPDGESAEDDCFCITDEIG